MHTPSLLTQIMLAVSALLAVSAPLAAMDQENHCHSVATTPTNHSCQVCEQGTCHQPTTEKITGCKGKGAKGAKGCHVICDNPGGKATVAKDPESVLQRTFGKQAPGAKKHRKAP